MINPLYTLSGFTVGALVGMTGVGGGSLMTPLLVLLFGIHPATAVGTDLLYAACTKSFGAMVHGHSRTVDWQLTRRLATGSLPASAAMLLLAHLTGLDMTLVSHLITPTLAVTIGTTAVLLVFQGPLLRVLGPLSARMPARRLAGLTIFAGAVLGVLVTISSVGAGALGVSVMTFLYPRHPIERIVGSDIAHAIPLTLLAGTGYWYLGVVDWTLLGSLLSGSIPGIIVGSLLAARAPRLLIRGTLAVTLALVAGKLLV